VATATATPLPPTATPEPPTLILWHDLPDDQVRELKEAVGGLQAAEPSVRMDFQHYDDEPALERSLSEGSVNFDIVLGNARAVGFMRDRGLIQPLDSLFDDGFWRGLARPGIQAVTQSSRVWGVPHTLGLQLMLFYNTKLIPAPPADTARMIAVASKLTGEGRFGLGMNALDPLWTIPWLSAYGGWPTDDQGRPTLNTAPMTQTLTFLYNLAYKYKVMAPTADYDTGLMAFKAGQTAMWIDGEWVLSALRDARDARWGVARLPVLTETGLEPACLVGGKYFVMGAQVKGAKLAAAQQLIAHLVSAESEKRWVESFRTLPASLQVLSGSLIQDDPFLRVSATQMLAGRAVGLSAGMQPAMDAMRGALEDVIYARIAPVEAARGMQARAEALLSR
jgi:maltose-binding protein MalE